MFSIQHPRHGEILVTAHVHYLLEKDKEEQVPQRSPAWFEKRKKHLTASTIASVCGENKYESRTSALKKKLGLEPSFQGNEATEWGNLNEPIAIDKYEKLTGNKVLEFGLLESINEGEEFLAGSPDGITSTGILIEVKCPFRRIPNGTVPDHYMHQLQTLMHILDLQECDFVEYCPATIWQDEILSIVRVPRDDQFWFRIYPKILSFWQDVTDFENSGKMPIILETKPKRKKTKKEEEKECFIQLHENQKVEDKNTLALPLVFFELLEERHTLSKTESTNNKGNLQ